MVMKREYSLADLMRIQNELNRAIDPEWIKNRSIEEFQVAIVDELAELLRSGVDFKFWKYTDPSKFDDFNLSIEVVDIVHFYLSLLIMKHSRSYPSQAADFSMYETTFISNRPEWIFGSLIREPNKLNNEAFVALARDLLSPIISRSVLFCLIEASGMSAEKVSALYAAKAALNEIRSMSGYKNGTYKKVQDGIEDNERLEFIVEDFLSDSEKSLDNIREEVNRFFKVGEDA